MSQTPNPSNLSDLVRSLGLARKTTQSAYKDYQFYKHLEDDLRQELETLLYVMDLRSAKGEDYTASIAEKPTVLVRDEVAIMHWLQDTPDVEYDQYVGLKRAEFKSLADSLLKNTGETVPGTEVEVRKSLRITANSRKEKTDAQLHD
jgi:hypothetical protein